MSKRKPMIDDEGEVRELTAEDLRAFKPIREAGLPDSLLKKLGVRGPQASPTKVRVSIRLSPEILAYFKAGGEGWQTRINQELLKLVRDRKAG